MVKSVCVCVLVVIYPPAGDTAVRVCGVIDRDDLHTGGRMTRTVLEQMKVNSCIACIQWRERAVKAGNNV